MEIFHQKWGKCFWHVIQGICDDAGANSRQIVDVAEAAVLGTNLQSQQYAKFGDPPNILNIHELETK